jgi:hypothetical protein
MSDYADLELNLRRHSSTNAYLVDLRFSQPDSDADIRLPPGEHLARLELNKLRALSSYDLEYGKLLGESLFANQTVWATFQQARSAADSNDAPLRFRLTIDSSADELHTVRWETLCDPQDGARFFTNERILFSRYLSSQDWRRVKLRPQSQLRALVAIANPQDVSDYNLASFDVLGELSRAQTSLGDMPITALAPNGTTIETGLAVKGTATLKNLSAQLRDDYDVLYLVAHGALYEGEPNVWLEDDTGNSHVVNGAELVTRIGELSEAPRLIVLASCQSANMKSSDDGALSALGPRLAAAGVSAVIAMQGNVALNTIAKFMPVFFSELQRDGQIDRAMAAARGEVRAQPDSWMPVLFMRLKSGKLWYVPGFTDERPGFERWPAVMRNIQQGRCTPILGTGMLEALLGTTSDIARRWADHYHYPLAPHQREDLTYVAQYLAVKQDKMYPRDELAESLKQELVKRFGHQLPAAMKEAALADWFTAVGALRRQKDANEPHQVLAKLPFTIYVTTNPDNLLEDALKAVGKDPQMEICPWNELMEQRESIFERESSYQPTKERPLVYHLFGHLSDPESLVLTEDNYFDYLIGVTKNKDLIPPAVRKALSDTALLFIGFALDEWDFRVLFRSIMTPEIQERSRGRKLAHVGAQITPEEGRMIELEGARRYLESYFGEAMISIYWGTVADFVQELNKRVKK